MIVSALVASTKALKDATLLSLLGFSIFSLIGNQLFSGCLKQKCVVKPPWMLGIDIGDGECLAKGSGHHNASIAAQQFEEQVRR